MRSSVRTRLCASLLVFIGVSAAAALGRELRTPEFLERARPGFDHFFNLEYEAGKRWFEELAHDFPNHPGPPLYLASGVWLEELFHRQELDLDKFLAPGYFSEKNGREMPYENRRLFFENLTRSREICERMLKETPHGLEARYLLGSVHGLQASFTFTIDGNWREAIGLGKKAYRMHSQIIDEAPEFYDAYMTVGMYEYIAGNLPWYIRWIATIIGYRGSAERGLRYLGEAMRHADFVADDTRVILMVLFVREQRYEEALSKARALRARYPRSYIFHLNQAQILERQGDMADALRKYREVARRAVDGAPNYRLLPLGSFSYQLGVKHRRAVQMPEARAFLEKAIAAPETPPTVRSRAHLELGEVLELLGESELARTQYRKVLDLPDVDGSRGNARRHLDRTRE